MEMTLSLKETNSVAGMAQLLYSFLPGSGASQWKGHTTFESVALMVGVGHLWQRGSKESSIAKLLELTLDSRRDLFEPLVKGIVREGIKYRTKNGDPISREEIEKLNRIVLEIGFKFPDL